MYTIIQSPDEMLRTPTKPVSFSGPKLVKIIDEMKQTLVAQKDPEGVGLAANQVGLPYSLFVVRFNTKKDEPILTFINPEAIAHSKEQTNPKDSKILEGCLSLARYWGPVKRFEKITIKYQTPDTEGKLIEKTDSFEAEPAIFIQHEMDHLQGKIFVERILEQGGKLYKVTGKTKNGKDIWEEVEL